MEAFFMRTLVQRVSRAHVRVDGQVTSQISKGLLLLVGFGPADQPADLDWMAGKVVRLRIFNDDEGKMNLSVDDVMGGLLVVSQFTLYGDCRKGNRPSFAGSASADQAIQQYKQFIDRLRLTGLKVVTGSFGAHMEVELVNDGPVTIWLQSPSEFQQG
jgi:D-tyrosyl-tRNA(Tyr) deacylase